MPPVTLTSILGAMDKYAWLWLVPPVLGVVVCIVYYRLLIHRMTHPRPLTDEDLAVIKACVEEMARKERDGDGGPPSPPIQ